MNLCVLMHCSSMCVVSKCVCFCLHDKVCISLYVCVCTYRTRCIFQCVSITNPRRACARVTVVVLCVCALAASASVYTYISATNDTHGFLLGVSWILIHGFSKYLPFESYGIKRFRAFSGPTEDCNYLKHNWSVECCFRD